MPTPAPSHLCDTPAPTDDHNHNHNDAHATAPPWLAPWVPARIAAAILGRPADTVRRLVKAGQVRAQTIPGCKALYSRDDLLKFAPPR